MINVNRTVISQYGNSPTILALIQNMDDAIDPRADLANFYNYVWNIDTAQGFGLDIWGRIIGVDRSINVPAGTPNPGGFPFTAGVYQMDDAQYRLVLMVKALANITDCTAKNLNQLLQKLFVGRGRCYVNDIGGMRLRYTFEFFLQPFEYVIMTGTNIAPRPAGVLSTILQIDPATTFGFNGSTLPPFNQGTFYRSR
jgi:hypothetical protein